MNGSAYVYGYAPAIATAYPFVYTYASAAAIEGGVTLTEAKAWLREVLSGQDTTIETMIVAATTQLEEELGIVCVRRSFTYKSNDYPWRQQMGLWGTTLQLPMAPFVSGCDIASLKYRDVNGTQQTIDSSWYTAQQVNGQYGAVSITIKPDQSWPSLDYYAPDAFEAVYTVGWTNVASVPALVKATINNKIQEMYERDLDRGENKSREQQTKLMPVPMLLNANNYLRAS